MHWDASSVMGTLRVLGLAQATQPGLINPHLRLTSQPGISPLDPKPLYGLPCGFACGLNGLPLGRPSNAQTTENFIKRTSCKTPTAYSASAFCLRRDSATSTPFPAFHFLPLLDSMPADDTLQFMESLYDRTSLVRITLNSFVRPPRGSCWTRPIQCSAG